MKNRNIQILEIGTFLAPFGSLSKL